MSIDASSPVEEAMSWEEYAAHEAPPSSEYIDGRMIMVPSPTQVHHRVCQELFLALRQVLPSSLNVTLGWGWKPGPDEFVPDVMVYPLTDESTHFTGAPVLLVEVLSTNRIHDLVRKSAKYAAAGAPHYWIVDPRDRAFDAFDLVDGTYESVLHLEGDEAAPVVFGSSRLTVDLKDILGSSR